MHFGKGSLFLFRVESAKKAEEYNKATTAMIKTIKLAW